MQIYNVNIESNGISINSEIHPTRYQDIKIEGGGRLKEEHLEDLIIQHPRLLNFDESLEDSEILIIGRQVYSNTRKKCDLIAIDQDGCVITIEVKRDAVDERNRIEPLEFQAIRYAASHRTLSTDQIIKIYAKYLQDLNGQDNSQIDYEDLAKQKICNHLSDADSVIEPNELKQYINPRDRQKIYLVASDFESDCLSACAWLRDHDIDIHCIKIQPYLINGKYVLYQQRIIPTIDLESYYVETREIDNERRNFGGVRTRVCNPKPVALHWNDETTPCKKWNELFQKFVTYALNAGLDESQIECEDIAYKEEDTKTWPDWKSKGTIVYNRGGEEKTLIIARHGSGEMLRNYMTKMFSKLSEKPTVLVDLTDGTTIELS